jgi:uncharacterized RDD family membrane protein YckC
MAPEFKQIDCTIDVVTPENIAFQYDVAGPFRRLPAFLIDVFLRLAVWIGCLILIGIAAPLIGGAGGALGIALWLLLWFVMEWFYGGLLETFWNGQTVGKRLMGIRVLGVDGQPIDGLQAVMRNILRLVDLMPFLPLMAIVGTEGPWILPTGMLGLVTSMLNRRFQRLGDVVCGTMVVVDNPGWILRTVKLEDPRIAQLAMDLPASFQVVGKLAQALAAYVERRPYLSSARREEIARHLADPLVQQLGVPPSTSHDLLLCALYYRTFVVNRSLPQSEQEGLTELLSRSDRQGLATIITG